MKIQIFLLFLNDTAAGVKGNLKNLFLLCRIAFGVNLATGAPSLLWKSGPEDVTFPRARIPPNR